MGHREASVPFAFIGEGGFSKDDGIVIAHTGGMFALLADDELFRERAA